MLATSAVRFSLAAALLLLPVTSLRAAGDSGIDLSRARAHVEKLAGTIGSRPTGSSANVRAREYLVDRLQQDGFVVRLQRADAVDERRGVTARVVNLIAVREGQRPDAIALVAHYDSVPDAPGAVDDALGVATCLEAARVLGQVRLHHTLLVLLTDGEELGLMGARAIVNDSEVASRLKTFLNFDGPAGAGTPLLFQASPGWGPPLDAWARSRTPSGASFAVEIYRRLPNDTDFTILNERASGLNFAPLADAYVYHNDRDVPDRVDSSTLEREIANTVDIVRSIDAFDGEPRSGSPTFFDVADRFAIMYGANLTRVIAWGAVASACVTWSVLTATLWRRRRWRLLLAWFWSLLSVVAALGLPAGATSLFRVIRRELNPWYASPIWYFVLLAAAGITGMWVVARLSSLAPERWRPDRGSAAVWWTALPGWIALAILFYRSAPAASYLVTVPLGFSAVLVLVTCWSPVLARFASGIVLAVVAALWAERMITILTLLVPLSGWLGIVMPYWLFPVAMGVAGLMFGPPLSAAIVGWRRRFSAPVVMGLFGLVAVAALLALASPAYTRDRPQRRAARYVQDFLTNQAWWEISGTEPVPGVESLPGAGWQRVDGPLQASVRLPPAGRPFQFRTAAEPLVTALPADVRASISASSGGRRLADIEVVPRENLTVRVVLPAGWVPVESSLVGRVTDGQWNTTYVSPPAEGFHLRLAFDAVSKEPLRPVVVLTTAGLPGGSGPLGLLAWLPQERSTWSTRSIYIVEAK
jgi:hypothetical protein